MAPFAMLLAALVMLFAPVRLIGCLENTYGMNNGPLAQCYLDLDDTQCTNNIESTVCEEDICDPSPNCYPTSNAVYAYCISADYFCDYPACFNCQRA